MENRELDQRDERDFIERIRKNNIPLLLGLTLLEIVNGEDSSYEIAIRRSIIELEISLFKSLIANS